MAGRPKSRQGEYERITLEVRKDLLNFIDEYAVSRRGFIEEAIEQERARIMTANLNRKTGHYEVFDSQAGG